MTSATTDLIIAGINAEVQLLPTEVQFIQDLIAAFKGNATPVSDAELEAAKTQAHALAAGFAAAIAARIAAQAKAAFPTDAVKAGGITAPSA